MLEIFMLTKTKVFSASNFLRGNTVQHMFTNHTPF